MTADIEPKLNRLTRLVGTDEGFYILALHSFIEYFLRYEKGYGEGQTFPQLTWRFREELLDELGDTFIDGLYCLGTIGKQHIFTNRVRHAFEKMDSEEAAAATHLFTTFCKLAGIDKAKQIRILDNSLDIWKDHTSVIKGNGIIRQMQDEIKNLQNRNKDLLHQKEEYEKLKVQLKEFKLKLSQYDFEIHKQQQVSRSKNIRLDRLRRERNDLIQERNDLLLTLKKFNDLERYLAYLGRLSLYTMTRLDYERSISQLTPEQEAVLSNIKLKKDFLIKGGAGTGKSLVLIECLRKAVIQNEFDFGKNENVVLVTFTRTLAKYNRYISEITGMDLPLDIISTVDTLFYKKLQIIYPETQYDFNLLESYFARERTPDFLLPAEIISEIDNFLFANAITREEYLEKLIPRHGMRQRLSRQQRRIIWKAREEFVDNMETNRTYTQNYGRLKLLKYLRLHPENKEIRDISYLFLDEVQDLTPVALMILRMLTTRIMVMAGDVDQSLYNYQSPFIRAEIKIRGTTRVLKTNFRNTSQICRLADSFRKRCPNNKWDNYAEAFAFREGPVPELYLSENADDMKKLLIKKLNIFIEDLGYDPGNICILVPRNVEIKNIKGHLKNADYQTVNINTENFSFCDTSEVRISTLHSSKGLDFPVVLLYLPYLHRRKHFSDEQTEILLRNLVYVSLTRAMDNLNIFTHDSDDPIIKDLIDSFGD